jgi:hypothetical protein
MSKKIETDEELEARIKALHSRYDIAKRELAVAVAKRERREDAKDLKECAERQVQRLHSTQPSSLSP